MTGLPGAMFFREFSVVKVKRAVRQSWEFPFSIDECPESPLAGPFSEEQLKAVDRTVGHLPFSQRTHDGRRAWSVVTKHGELDVWLTSDGSVFIEGETSLNLVYAVFLQVLEVCPDVVLEDRITGELHDRASLLRLVRRDEQKTVWRLTTAAMMATAQA
ncbi:MAG: hypothetical protein JNJ54_01920 [Myxococcaceae bacterium]|nr:hypothetical protein [Myxococcaceae bacterium]